MKPIVVYNEQAGTTGNKSDDPTPDSLRAAFAEAGVEVEVHAVPGPGIIAALRDAVARRPPILYVGGGDGTISTAAGLLVGTDITLGVLPFGTLNHFAHDLGVPENWREAVPALAQAPTCKIDVAEVNGRVFINNCSLGSYAEAVRRRDALRRQKGHGKWRAMIAASWSVFWELRRLRLRIETPDRVLTLRTPFVLVANNRYTGSVLNSNLRPRLDEGRLWLYMTRARRHGALIRLIWQTLTRRIDTADELEVHSVTDATISGSGSPVPVAADGEILKVTQPLRFRSLPAALRVLVPRSTPTG